ncbi:hypothetical protein LIER_31541 [Lithospermum erythrorhizon]|uniref:Zinc knuckle CX2CX4HX4C domain-containing protein n=1 Tax=Lithospermum erythrorhizon TaxID=34254 RepID=A0AAV3RT61_LITER
MFSKIASFVENPLYDDGAISDVAHISIGRLCVEINARDEQRNEVPVVNERGETFMKKVIYEFTPPKCSHCCLFGHFDAHCRFGGRAKAANVVVPQQVWMKKHNRVKEIVVEEKKQEDVEEHSQSFGQGLVQQCVAAIDKGIFCERGLDEAVAGHGMDILHIKIKKLKVKLKELNATEFSNISTRVLEKHHELVGI